MGLNVGFMYHVALVNKRWLLRVHQDDRGFDRKQQTLIACGSTGNGGALPQDYMQEIENIFPAAQGLDRPSPEDLVRINLEGKLFGTFRQYVKAYRDDDEKITGIVGYMTAKLQESDQRPLDVSAIGDPTDVRSKGRPKNSSRMKSCVEPGTKSKPKPRKRKQKGLPREDESVSTAVGVMVDENNEPDLGKEEKPLDFVKEEKAIEINKQEETIDINNQEETIDINNQKKAIDINKEEKPTKVLNSGRRKRPSEGGMHKVKKPKPEPTRPKRAVKTKIPWDPTPV